VKDVRRLLTYSAGVLTTELAVDPPREKLGGARLKEERPCAGLDCCALRRAPACLSNECDEIDFSNIATEAAFFFKIGFLLMKDDECDNRLGGGDEFVLKGFLVVVCNGPYSHVTSQSFSQLSFSGETVLKLFFALVHVLHDAFSNRTLLVMVFRLATIYLHEDQISSSFHSWAR
jgi:hypothetical protein